jgi:multiple antibiotic resistance protein
MIREYIGFGLIALSAVFFVVDPFAAIPIFLAITSRETPEQRARTALRAAITCGLTLTVFALAGGVIFRFFGISLGAFKIAGGVLLFLMSLDMMKAQPSRTKQTPEETEEGIEKEDVAVIPLAIPLLSGPGAIATVMVLMTRHKEWTFTIPVFGAIVVTAGSTYLLLRAAVAMHQRLSRTALNVMMRVMGLILAAIAVEFVVAGGRDVWPVITGAAR